MFDLLLGFAWVVLIFGPMIVISYQRYRSKNEEDA
jgi:hypothetical protein